MGGVTCLRLSDGFPPTPAQLGDQRKVPLTGPAMVFSLEHDN
jgi:hypothetical protein